MIQGYSDYLLVQCGMYHDSGIFGLFVGTLWDVSWSRDIRTEMERGKTPVMAIFGIKKCMQPKKFTFLTEARVPEYYHLIIPVVQ